MFRLPFLQFAAGWTFAALLVVLIVSAVFHYLNGGIRLQSPFQRVTPQVKVHLSVLLALMALTKTVQYYLAQFALDACRTAASSTARRYTDVHAQLPALRLLMVISIAAAVLVHRQHLAQGLGVPDHRGRSLGLHLDRGRHDLPGGDPAVHGAAERVLARAAVHRAQHRRRRAPRSTSTTRRSRRKPFTYQPDAERRPTPRPTGRRSTTCGSTTRGPTQDDFQVDAGALRRLRVRRRRRRPLQGRRRERRSRRSRRCASSIRRTFPTTRGRASTSCTRTATARSRRPRTRSTATSRATSSRTSRRTGELAHSIRSHAGVTSARTLTGYAVVDTKVAEQEATTGTAAPRRRSTRARAGVQVSSFLRKAALALALRRLEPVRVGPGHEQLARDLHPRRRGAGARPRRRS